LFADADLSEEGMAELPSRLTARSSRSRARARDEAGFVVPTVLFFLLAILAVVTVALLASIQAQSGSIRDQGTKAAVATAEAGVTQAVFNYNGGFTLTDNSGRTNNPCLVPVTNPPGTVQPRATAATYGANSWCTPVAAASGTGAYTYQVCPVYTDSTGAVHNCPSTSTAGSVEVVSTGTVNGVTRRVDVIAKSVSGQPIFIDAGVKSQTNLIVDSNGEVHSASSAGGSIILGSTSAKLCGGATVGPTGSATGAGTYTASTDCTGTHLSLGTVGHQPLTLPPVNQGTAATVNDDCRIRAAVTNAAACSPNDYRDLISGNTSDVTWNPSTRQLAMSGQKTSLTLTGQTYSFCKLTMSQNSTLYAAANQKVRIFFDSPEACGLPAYNASNGTTQKATAQLYTESNTRITASGDPNTTSLGIYAIGSQTIPTGILMSSNSDNNAACVQNFVIYAPLTNIELNSNSTYCGAIAGLSIHLDQNARFYTDAVSQAIPLPGTAPHYTTSRFVDCSAGAASPPNAGC
jgi:hypothetical protein